MPDIVIKKTNQALRLGYSRGEYPTLLFPAFIAEDASDGLLPNMVNIDGKADELGQFSYEHIADGENLAPSTGLNTPEQVQGTTHARPSRVSELSTAPVNTR